MDALETIPEKTTAKNNDVSPSRVSSVLNPLLYGRKSNMRTLPQNIMVDELKLIKDDLRGQHGVCFQQWTLRGTDP